MASLSNGAAQTKVYEFLVTAEQGSVGFRVQPLEKPRFAEGKSLDFPSLFLWFSFPLSLKFLPKSFGNI
jgi:hypothetical protein